MLALGATYDRGMGKGLFSAGAAVTRFDRDS